MLLSDGQFQNMCVVAFELHRMIGKLAPFTIIKVKKHTCTALFCWKLVEILEVEIVTPGNQVGNKLGNPVEIGPDGKIPNPKKITYRR